MKLPTILLMLLTVGEPLGLSPYAIGDEASIEVEAISERSFKGLVTEIANSAATSRS